MLSNVPTSTGRSSDGVYVWRAEAKHGMVLIHTDCCPSFPDVADSGVGDDRYTVTTVRIRGRRKHRVPAFGLAKVVFRNKSTPPLSTPMGT